MCGISICTFTIGGANHGSQRLEACVGVDVDEKIGAGSGGKKRRASGETSDDEYVKGLVSYEQMKRRALAYQEQLPASSMVLGEAPPTLVASRQTRVPPPNPQPAGRAMAGTAES